MIYFLFLIELAIFFFRVVTMPAIQLLLMAPNSIFTCCPVESSTSKLFLLSVCVLMFWHTCWIAGCTELDDTNEIHLQETAWWFMCPAYLKSWRKMKAKACTIGKNDWLFRIVHIWCSISISKLTGCKKPKRPTPANRWAQQKKALARHMRAKQIVRAFELAIYSATSIYLLKSMLLLLLMCFGPFGFFRFVFRFCLCHFKSFCCCCCCLRDTKSRIRVSILNGNSRSNFLA